MARLSVRRPLSASHPESAARRHGVTVETLPRAPAEAPLLSDVLDAFEEHARTCAARLHDTVLQDLYALRMSAPSLAAEEIETRLGHLAAVVSRLVETLSPPVLDDFGLPAALGSLARMSESQVEVYETSSEPARLSRRTARYLFRVAQEGVEQIARQSGDARVRLDVHPATVTLTIEGVSPGTSPSDASTGERLGPIRAASYARALGGTLAVCESSQGSVYRASVPRTRGQ